MAPPARSPTSRARTPATESPKDTVTTTPTVVTTTRDLPTGSPPKASVWPSPGPLMSAESSLLALTSPLPPLTCTPVVPPGNQWTFPKDNRHIFPIEIIYWDQYIMIWTTQNVFLSFSLHCTSSLVVSWRSLTGRVILIYFKMILFEYHLERTMLFLIKEY